MAYFTTTLLSRLLHVLPSWSRFLSLKLFDQIDAFFKTYVWIWVSSISLCRLCSFRWLRPCFILLKFWNLTIVCISSYLRKSFHPRNIVQECITLGYLRINSTCLGFIYNHMLAKACMFFCVNHVFISLFHDNMLITQARQSFIKEDLHYFNY